MDFRIKRPTRLVNGKGVDMGAVSELTFTTDKWEKTFNGKPYQRYSVARWIPVEDIEPITVDPPPVDPPPVDPPPVTPSVYPDSYQIRYPNISGSFEGQPWQEYRKNV